MTKNRAIILALALSLVLACSVSLGNPPTAIPAPTSTAISTFTEAPPSQDLIATIVAQTVEAQQPVATEPPPPTIAPTPLSLATALPLKGTQWSGKFRWHGTPYPVTFMVQKINGSKFTGAMFWSFTQCRANMGVEGDVITDITTATEQERWKIHPDYESGDLGGTWLRWTQNKDLGARCTLTITGDWWYAHIRADGHMVGIHFTNSTNTIPDKDATFDFTTQ